MESSRLGEIEVSMAESEFPLAFAQVMEQCLRVAIRFDSRGLRRHEVPEAASDDSNLVNPRFSAIGPPLHLWATTGLIAQCRDDDSPTSRQRGRRSHKGRESVTGIGTYP